MPPRSHRPSWSLQSDVTLIDIGLNSFSFNKAETEAAAVDVLAALVVRVRPFPFLTWLPGAF